MTIQELNLLPAQRVAGPAAVAAKAGAGEACALQPDTIAAQGGGIVDTETGAIVPPIHTATTLLDLIGDIEQALAGVPQSRTSDRTVQLKEVL